MSRYHFQFVGLADEALDTALDKESQYQLNLTDGCYLFMLDEEFEAHKLSLPDTYQGQVILQYFANWGCPFSMLRLGQSLSERVCGGGPMTSDQAAVWYLLSGIEMLINMLSDFHVKLAAEGYMTTREFYLACELLHSYIQELDTSAINPEILSLLNAAVQSKTQLHD